MSGEPLKENEVPSADLPKPVRQETNWLMVLFYIYFNMSALYALFLIFTQARLSTILFGKYNTNKFHCVVTFPISPCYIHHLLYLSCTKHLNSPRTLHWKKN